MDDLARVTSLNRLAAIGGAPLSIAGEEHEHNYSCLLVIVRTFFGATLLLRFMAPAHPNSDENRSFGTGSAASPKPPNSFTPDDPQNDGGKGPFLFIGNFHKTLPHNVFGEVLPSAYRDFALTCLNLDSGSSVSFENIPRGDVGDAQFDGKADPGSRLSAAGFVSPMAGAARESLGPDPKELEMLPAPGIQSLSSAAEMTEIYWMALLRDQPLRKIVKGEPLVDQALSNVNNVYSYALENDTELGRVRLTLDLPPTMGANPVFQAGTEAGAPPELFRMGLAGERHGPLVSQFFLQDVPYGTQVIDSRQVPYAAKKDFLTTHLDWLRAQNLGKDAFARSYGNGNNAGDDNSTDRSSALYYRNSKGDPILDKRYISTMRDLARFVNRDALHQAYFNAALFLDAVGASLDDGNPYKTRQTRDVGFATLAGPDLLTLVSEVASRALKVVWRQKWLVHRRCRPEVYGGLVQMQRNGLTGREIKQFDSSLAVNDSSVYKREYGLPLAVPGFDIDSVLSLVEQHNHDQRGQRTSFLPMAFSAGSPAHPAYGAGHATVAGACVTALKAWFDEDQLFEDLLAKYNGSSTSRKDPGPDLGILLPGDQVAGSVDSYGPPSIVSPGSTDYKMWELDQLTVGGELNKIASNVAMGRTMGGVHWRTDNTRSLRLGEQVAIEILRKRTTEYAEKGVSFTFRSFDRKRIRIAGGKVDILD